MVEVCEDTGDAGDMRRRPVLQDMATDDCAVACLAYIAKMDLSAAKRYFRKRTPPGGYLPRELLLALHGAKKNYELVGRRSLAGGKRNLGIFLFSKWAKYDGRFFSHYVVWHDGAWMDPLCGWRCQIPETAVLLKELRQVDLG